MTIWIGIDPGKKGGVAVIFRNEVSVYPWDDTEFVKKMDEMRGRANLGAEPIIAAVEKVGAMSYQGVKSMFSFGKSAGFIEGVLMAYSIPYQLVPPIVWKKSFSLIGTEKRASIEVAKKLLPGVNFLPTERSRVESDGMADAALLALYAQRHF